MISRTQALWTYDKDGKTFLMFYLLYINNLISLRKNHVLSDIQYAQIDEIVNIYEDIANIIKSSKK